MSSPSQAYNRSRTLSNAGLAKRVEELVEVTSERGGLLAQRYLEEERPGTGEPRYMKMLAAADKRACAGDMKAIAWFFDRAFGKAAMAATDREAGRPILQVNNNQIIAQAPASSDPAPLRPTITLPSVLPGSPSTSDSTSATNKLVESSGESPASDVSSL